MNTDERSKTDTITLCMWQTGELTLHVLNLTLSVVSSATIYIHKLCLSTLIFWRVGDRFVLTGWVNLLW